MAYTIKVHEEEKYISVITEGTLDIKEITAGKNAAQCRCSSQEHKDFNF